MSTVSTRIGMMVMAIALLVSAVVMPQATHASVAEDRSATLSYEGWEGWDWDFYADEYWNDPAYRLRGKILLQVEENGEAWYVDPTDERRYYLGRPHDAFDIMRYLGHGISNDDLDRIAIAGDVWQGDRVLVNRMKGKILLQVEKNGEAWYVHPDSGQRYYLGRPDDAFQIMRDLSLGATNEDIFAISSNVSLDYMDFTDLGREESFYFELFDGSFPREEIFVDGRGRLSQNISGWTVHFPDGLTYTFPYKTVVDRDYSVVVDRFYAGDEVTPFWLKEWLYDEAIDDYYGRDYLVSDKKNGGNGSAYITSQNGTVIDTYEVPEYSVF